LVRAVVAPRTSWFDRLGIILVILGLIQSLAPLAQRPDRLAQRLALQPRTALPATEPDGVPDEESHDTENQAETIAWPEAVAEGRSARRAAPATSFGSLPQPGRSALRTRSMLQEARALPILAADAAGAPARLVRFLC
jgi:hypothetical protein